MLEIQFLLFGLICSVATFLSVQIYQAKQRLIKADLDLSKRYKDFEASLSTVVADHNAIMQAQGKQSKEIDRLTLICGVLGARK